MKLLKEDNVIHIKDDFTLINDNSLNMLDYLEEESVDAIVCDPPYELGFMGKKWDSTGIAYNVELWQKALKILKRGGFLLAFGGTRTYHRIACAIEDAGFEIRDCIMWLYGSGFPKSHNIGLAVDEINGIESKVVGNGKSGSSSHAYQSEEITTAGEYQLKQAQNEWNGWGTALKPAYEPIIVARKPTNLTIAENCLKYGVGGINIDECRVGNETINIHNAPKGTFAGGDYNRGSDIESYRNSIGRFPANVITDGSDEVASGMPNTNGSTGKPFNKNDYKDENNIFNRGNYIPYNDEGSAMRYFYSAKASKKDRDEGLDILEEIDAGTLNNRKEGSAGLVGKYGGGTNPFLASSSPRKNIHPTVKPIELMQYLVRLVSPKGATIVDIFNGSGSTGKAVAFENREREANYKYVGIELSKEYCDISKLRIEYGLYKYQYDLEQDIKKDEIENGQLSLFDIGDDNV